MTNLFLELQKGNQREEEFFTRAFIYIIENSKDLTVKLIKSIFEINISREEEIKIYNELSFDEGRLDIAIETNEYFFIIENKLESSFEDTQIGRYKKYITEKKLKIATLTKYYCAFKEGQKPDYYKTWFNIYDVLRQYSNSLEKGNEILYTLKEFMGFMEVKGMTVNRVSGDCLKSGLIQLFNLIGQIQKGAEENKLIMTQRSAGWDIFGFYFKDSSIRIGIRLSKPEIIIFQIWESLKIKENVNLRYKKQDPKPFKGVEYILDLESEKYFGMNKEEQYGLVKIFINEINLAIEE